MFMSKVFYKGKEIELISELNDDEILDDDLNNDELLEDTIEFDKPIDLENTTEFDLHEIKNLYGDYDVQ